MDRAAVGPRSLSAALEDRVSVVSGRDYPSLRDRLWDNGLLPLSATDASFRGLDTIIPACIMNRGNKLRKRWRYE